MPGSMTVAANPHRLPARPCGRGLGYRYRRSGVQLVCFLQGGTPLYLVTVTG
jgi:hypothetical protein